MDLYKIMVSDKRITKLSNYLMDAVNIYGLESVGLGKCR